MAASVQDVLASRSGAVLGPRAAIKSDHFPGCQKETLEGPKLDGGKDRNDDSRDSFACVKYTVFHLECACMTLKYIYIYIYCHHLTIHQ